MTQTSSMPLIRAFLRAGLLPISTTATAPAAACVTNASLATVLSNMAHFGYTPNLDVITRLAALDDAHLIDFWNSVEPALANLTGADRKMDSHIVYKNFPQEVLSMSAAEYFIRQVFIYLGVPQDLLTEEEEARAPMDETLTLKVLAASGEKGAKGILGDLVARPTTWTDAQFEDATILARQIELATVDFSHFPAKANAARLAGNLLYAGQDITLRLTAPIDALRVIAVISGGDARLSTPFRVRSLKRDLRRRLVASLDAMGAAILAEAFAQRRELWKKVLMRLHPGDYAAANLNAAYDLLYRRKAEGFEALLVKKIDAADPEALILARQRPGTFARRLRHLHGTFGRAAFEAFIPVTAELTTLQLLRLDRIFATLSERKTRLYVPKGRFARARVVDAPSVDIPAEDITFLQTALTEVLIARLARAIPEGVGFGQGIEKVKLPMNGQELSAHGRGTTFAIPENVSFIRTMSYWQVSQTSRSVWFDNSWNLYFGDWTPAGTVCWNASSFGKTDEPAGIFSGDPVSSQTGGKAAQAIDLYIDRLQEAGVKYAVWSTLCYNSVPFSAAAEVFACLQWGEDAQNGAIFEPARAQMAFPIKSDELVNVTAFVDVDARELTYLDVALPLSVQSAKANGGRLAKFMPALLETIEAQPSLADLFGHAMPGSMPVLRDDAERPVVGAAHVEMPVNQASKIEPFDLSGLLTLKG